MSFDTCLHYLPPMSSAFIVSIWLGFFLNSFHRSQLCIKLHMYVSVGSHTWWLCLWYVHMANRCMIPDFTACTSHELYAHAFPLPCMYLSPRTSYPYISIFACFSVLWSASALIFFRYGNIEIWKLPVISCIPLSSCISDVLHPSQIFTVPIN